MALSKEPYRGTRDFFPVDKRIRDYLFSVMEKTALSFGYESYDGPILEEVELYKAKSGEELINDQIYSFVDRGERFVAIRPEMTPTLARMVAKVHREIQKPIRWFSIPNLMRYEKPQRGRVREHWQLNVDIFGASPSHSALEILQVVITLFKNFGANESHFEILINDRNIVDAVFNQLLQTSAEQNYRLYKIIDKSKKLTPEALEKLINEVQLSEQAKILFKEYLNMSSFDEVQTFLKTHRLESSLQEFSTFLELAKSCHITPFLKYDPTIVRGLDYYTGVVFEVFDKHPDNRRALSGGGAYAHLLKIFNEESVPGVGFGLGDVTLRDFLETHKLLPNFDVASNDIALVMNDPNSFVALNQLASSLRSNGFKVIQTLDCLNFKKMFPFAEKKGALFIGFMGGDEVNQQTIQIKNLGTKEQTSFQLNDLEKIVNHLKNK